MASAAPPSSCCPIRISASAIWRGSGRVSASLRRKIAEQIEIDAKYDVYLSRQAADVESYRRDESLVLAGRYRLCGAARPVQRGPPQAASPPAAHHRPGRPHRRHHAGGADAAGRASAPAEPQTAGGAADVGRPGRPAEVRPAVCGRVRPPVDLADDRAQALALTPVSRETADRLDRFVAVLLDWQQRINLIAPSTEPKLWTRHIADSLQLLALAPDARDMGRSRLRRRVSRPGDRLRAGRSPGARVHLVESNTKKAAFCAKRCARPARRPSSMRADRGFRQKRSERIES